MQTILPGRDEVPSETWQVFFRARRLLGMAAMLNLFGNSQTQLYRWSRCPLTTADTERNPLDRLQVMFREMAAAGDEATVLSALHALAEALPGARVVLDGRSCPDQPTIEGELLDDYPVLVELHAAIRDGRPVRTVRTLAAQVRREIDETVQRYEDGNEVRQ
jgi:hypothetical protein